MSTEVSKFKAFYLAARPKTLLAAFVPVLVGSALAFKVGYVNYLYLTIALLCSIFIQIGTNYTNDLYDYLKGADTKERKGPLRVLVSGLISVKEMQYAIFIIFFIAFLLGLYLVINSSWVILAIGIISILAGFAYTAGPYPLAYNGLGDIFVFLFFGVAGTMGTYFLHQQEFSLISFLASVPVGALITNILIINNYRDIAEDKAAGKNTLAVIFGPTFSQLQLLLLTLISYFVPIVLYFFFNFNIVIFLPLLSLPLAATVISMIFNKTGESLNKTLELSAKLSAIFGLLFSIGLLF